MYIIQHTGWLAPELKGEIVGRGKTVKSAISNMIKTIYDDEEPKRLAEIKKRYTNDKYYVYKDGEACFKITKI